MVFSGKVFRDIEDNLIETSNAIWIDNMYNVISRELLV